MGEKKLRLQNDCVLIGDLEFYFNNDSPILHSSYENAKKEECFDEDKLKIIIFGRIWSPQIGGGPFGNNMSLVEISFEKSRGCRCIYSLKNDSVREKIFCKKFLVLLLSSLNDFRNSSLPDFSREKSKALNDMFLEIEEEIRTLDYIVKIERFLKKLRIERFSKQNRDDIKLFANRFGLSE